MPTLLTSSGSAGADRADPGLKGSLQGVLAAAQRGLQADGADRGAATPAGQPQGVASAASSAGRGAATTRAAPALQLPLGVPPGASVTLSPRPLDAAQAPAPTVAPIVAQPLGQALAPVVAIRQRKFSLQAALGPPLQVRRLSTAP
jgi:hypothetical protein